MAYLPPKKSEVFDHALDGVYGHFKTRDSYDLAYLLTSIRTEKLEELKTASEVLELDMIDFEEIVQRDIDLLRVQEEIVDRYLEHGAGRVIFFPPLLVGIICLEKDRPIKQYSKVEAALQGAEFTITYDSNRFQIRLNKSVEETPHYLRHQNKTVYYYNYAATLKYNSDKVRLVVLDGQHRLMALRKLIEGGNKDLIAGIDVPVCVFFSPDARAKVQPDESLLKDMRELFVRINEEAKRVSGHFIWLLKDKSLAAVCVRAFGDLWKNSGPKGIPLLHQLEWNQREEKLASLVTRPYTVTTVSIIADALAEYIFNDSEDQKKGYTHTLLNLAEVDTALRVNPHSLASGSISEKHFDPDQLKTLKGQIEKYVAPSLDILFRTPSPFTLLRKVFEEAVKTLDAEIRGGKFGAAQFKADVLGKFRTAIEKLDQVKVVDKEKEFNALFDSEELHEIEFYRRNVFQQALIRAWARLFTELKPLKGVTPQTVAKSLVSALEVICFSTKKRYFSDHREYTQHVIYRGTRIIVNGVSKTGNRNLLLATFSNDKVRSEFLKALGLSGRAKTKADTDLKSIGVESASDYLSTFQQNYIKHLKKNWRWAGLKADDVKYLDTRYDSQDAVKKTEFRTRIATLSEKPVEKARSVLANMLGVKSSELDVFTNNESDDDRDSESL